MHIVEKDKAVAGGCEVPFKHGNDFFVGCFVLGVSDGVFAVVDFFTVLVETEREGGDVKRRGDLREKTIAEEGLS